MYEEVLIFLQSYLPKEFTYRNTFHNKLHFQYSFIYKGKFCKIKILKEDWTQVKIVYGGHRSTEVMDYMQHTITPAIIKNTVLAQERFKRGISNVKI